MPDPEILLPAGPERTLLDQPDAEKLRQEVESLRKQLEQEREKNKPKDKGPQRPKTRTLWLIALGLLIVLVLAFFLGFLPHHKREEQLKEDAKAEADALPVLSFVYAQKSPAETKFTLPGNIEALTEAPVLARADGYLKKRYVDIGDRVKEGQLLAEVTAPDLDRQVDQARAQLLQARAALRQSMAALEQGKANQRLSKVTADRWAALLKRGAVAPQDNDSKQADYQAQTANVGALDEAVSAAQQNASAAESNLKRLQELQGYEQVRAPFSGVVTLRNIDAGTLITTGQTLLFRIAQVDRLRTYLYVPEANATLVQVGQKATLSVEAFPGRQFLGTITRTSEALDPSTRTLLTEVQVPNPGNTLAPGMFSEVTLNQHRPHPPVLIPSDAIIVRPNGLFVAVLLGNAPDQESKEDSGQGQGQIGQDEKKGGDSSKKGDDKDAEKSNQDDRKEKQELENQQKQLPTYTVHLSAISVGRDYGNATEVLTGVSGGERIIESPNDHVEENAKVKGERATENPVKQAPGQGGGKKQNNNADSERLPQHPNAEPQPKEPSKERLNRGPGK